MTRCHEDLGYSINIVFKGKEKKYLRQNILELEIFRLFTIFGSIMEYYDVVIQVCKICFESMS